jgi:hypothetical protein
MFSEQHLLNPIQVTLAIRDPVLRDNLDMDFFEAEGCQI